MILERARLRLALLRARLRIWRAWGLVTIGPGWWLHPTRVWRASQRLLP